MTRTTKVDRGPWWMFCDRPGCGTEVGPFGWSSPDLAPFAAQGWFIAKLWGDRCPACVAAGLVDKVEPYPGLPSPIDVAGGSL